MQFFFLAVMLAAGQPVDTKAFDRRYDAAVRLFKHGQHQRALAEFQQFEGLPLEPRRRAAVTYSMGRCHQELGDTDQAIALFDKALAQAPPDYTALIARIREERSAVVKARRVRLTIDCDRDHQQVVVKLIRPDMPPKACPDVVYPDLDPGPYTIEARWNGRVWWTRRGELRPGVDERVALPSPGRLSISSPVEGSRVALDDRPLGNAPVDRILPPGQYVVTVSGPQGYLPWTQSVDLAPSQVLSLDARPKREEIPFDPWPWASAGGAAAAVGLGAILAWQSHQSGVEADSAYAGYLSSAVGDRGRLRRQVEAADDRTDAFAVGSGVAFAVGAGLAATAVYLWVDAPGVEIAPTISTDEVGVGMTWGF